MTDADFSTEGNMSGPAMEARTEQQGQQQPEASTSGITGTPKPTVIIVIGMAGSGKTTFIQRLQSHLHTQRTPPYIINMDPAVTYMPYSPNIDIRDTVKYKNVMKQYHLGPNGGILTSCNLFATRFDQVIGLLEKPRDPPLQHVLLDTPGQIEIFTWSASGQIVTELLASSFPTCIVYVIDTPRCTAPQTFMSNMLQAVSILYKTKLPMILVFNKIDVAHHQFALDWMEDFELYHTALEADASYASTLSRSLSLVLDEFYKNLRTAGCSALTGEGMEDFFKVVGEAAEEYNQYYLPELEAKRRANEEKKRKAQEKQMEAVRRDLAESSIATQPASAAGPSSGSRQATGSGSRTVVRSAGGAVLGSLVTPGFDDDAMSGGGGEDSGCEYALSDDSIEDVEAEEARAEQRAK